MGEAIMQCPKAVAVDPIETFSSLFLLAKDVFGIPSGFSIEYPLCLGIWKVDNLDGLAHYSTGNGFLWNSGETMRGVIEA